ncbi:GNAT family N-acetyltransferase [Streptomyces tricolor]|uniref:GNAT family N-acetyltransferase n=1 Tax=Streptomyces tricolor TaxID=68277 RepID=UPI0036E70EFF
MSGTEIRDGRAAGRLEAVGDGEVAGRRIEYVVLEPPVRSLVPVRTIVEPAREGKGAAGVARRELYVIAEREGDPVAPPCPYVVQRSARHPEKAPPADRSCCRPAAKDWLRACPGRF